MEGDGGREGERTYTVRSRETIDRMEAMPWSSSPNQIANETAALRGSEWTGRDTVVLDFDEAPLRAAANNGGSGEGGKLGRQRSSPEHS